MFVPMQVPMAQRKNPFDRHRFTCGIILMAVRWYCRYPLSCRNLRAISVDAFAIHRWVRKYLERRGAVGRNLTLSDHT